MLLRVSLCATVALHPSTRNLTCNVGNGQCLGEWGRAVDPTGAPEEHALAGEGDAELRGARGWQPEDDSQRGARHRGPDSEDHRLLWLQPRILQSQK